MVTKDWERLGTELGRLEKKCKTNIHFCDTVLPLVEKIESKARLEEGRIYERELKRLKAKREEKIKSELEEQVKHDLSKEFSKIKQIFEELEDALYEPKVDAFDCLKIFKTDFKKIKAKFLG